MESFFIEAYFDDKSYASGGIALVHTSSAKPNRKRILVLHPGDHGSYSVDEFPQSDYAALKGCKKLHLTDAAWDAVVRYHRARKGDSKKEEKAATNAVENAIGLDIIFKMQLAGGF